MHVQVPKHGGSGGGRAASADMQRLQARTVLLGGMSAGPLEGSQASVRQGDSGAGRMTDGRRHAAVDRTRRRQEGSSCAEHAQRVWREHRIDTVAQGMHEHSQCSGRVMVKVRVRVRVRVRVNVR